MKKPVSLLLTIILILALTASSAVSQANEKQALIKDETVYANLNADGSIGQIYVVNRVETPEKGVYTDYGNYTSVLNLSGSQQPSIDDDEIRWQKADEVLYYQGKLAQGQLPFAFALEYKLNGVSVTPQEALGKSGAIAIAIAVQPNEQAKAYFRKNYVAQIQIPLNLETTANILAPGAVSVITGKTANLAYTVLPGQKASFTLQFDTDKFELDPITFACTPFDTSTFNLDAAEISSGLSQLNGGLDQLVEGSKKLKQGLADLNSGLSRLSGGASALAAGVGSYTDAAGQIHENAQLINIGLSQLGNEGEGLNAGYQQLVGGLNDAITGLPAQLAALELTPQQQQALGQILAGMSAELNAQLTGFGQGLQEYTTGISQTAQGMGELTLGLEAFASEGQDMETGADSLAEGLQKMGARTGRLPGDVQALIEGQRQIKEGFLEAGGILAKFELPDGNEQPVSFVSDKVTPRSVQFIASTPALNAETEETKKPAETEEKANFFTRLLNLFNIKH